MFANIMQGILVVAIEVICCKIFLEGFLKKKTFRKEGMGIVILILLTAIIYLGTLFLTKYFFLKELFVLCAISILMKLYFEVAWKKELLLSVLYLGLLLCVDFGAVMAIQYVLPLKAQQHLNEPMESTLLVLICKMVLFGLVSWIRKRWGKDEVIRSFTDQEWIRFSCFPAFTIATIIIIMVNFDVLKGNREINSLLAIAFGLVFMNLMVYHLMNDVIAREQKLKESRIFEERVLHQTELYHSISENSERQRKWIHEYKNQMNCMEGLLRAGKIEEARKYVAGITGKLHREYDAIDTNHVIVNAILNSKYEEAMEKNILMIFKISDLSKLSWQDEDIVTILSNLLSNAIEACEQVEGRRQIKVKFINDAEKTVLSVQNTYDIIQKREDGTYETWKEDKQMHGIGMTNIYETVQKYQGECFWTEDDREFFYSITTWH